MYLVFKYICKKYLVFKYILSMYLVFKYKKKYLVPSSDIIRDTYPGSASKKIGVHLLGIFPLPY